MIDMNRLRDLSAIVAACVLLVLAMGCSSTRYVPLENVRTEYKDRVVTVHDTVTDTVLSRNDTYRHDSTAIAVKGDTVYVDRWHTVVVRSLEKASHRTERTFGDSASTVRVDSVKVPYPVKRKLTKWEKVKMDTGGLSLGIAGIALIAGIVALVRWLRIKIKRK